MHDTDIGRLILKYASKKATTLAPPDDACTDRQASTAPTPSPPAAPLFDWDNPDANDAHLSPTPSTPDGNEPAPIPACRRMSAAQRTRLICYNRQQRRQRAAAINDVCRRVIRHSAAFRPFSLAPAPPGNIGVGHSAYTLGPITFCKRCGATKSLSQGMSLQRPCRRWAPAGTRAGIKTLLRGKPQPFYQRILLNAAAPVRRIRQKTTPAPRYIIPQHLQAADDPVPHAPPPRAINITRHTVWQGTAAGPDVPRDRDHATASHSPPGEGTTE